MSYDASDITVLEGLDAVRKRPGMYIGSTGERGLHHLVYEVVDNAVDEAMAGFADTITVTLLPDSRVRVVDNGRGIPVDEHPVEKKPAVEVVLTVLHAGGKFGGSGYSVSGGLHGVGVSVVNALSTELTVEVCRDGFQWSQAYDHGVPRSRLAKGDATERTGTTVTFQPNADIFETTRFDFDILARRFQEMAFLNRGLTITLRDERIPELVEEEDPEDAEMRSVTYHYAGGIADFVRHLNASRGPAHPNIIEFGGENVEQGISAEVALQWNNSFAESVYTFANTINTTEGGTHEEGFRTALTSMVNKYAREWGVLKEKDANLSGDDIREGLTAIVSVKLREPQFEGQTKTKLGNTEAKAFVQKVTHECLEWFDRNPAEGKGSRPQGAASLRRADRRPSGPRPGAQQEGPAWWLWPAGEAHRLLSHDPEVCEIFIVEGDSAAAPRAAAGTRRLRRSCRSAARSSTSSAPGSTRSWATPRCRP